MLDIENIRKMIQKDVEEKLNILNIKFEIEVKTEGRANPFTIGLEESNIENIPYCYIVNVAFRRYGEIHKTYRIIRLDNFTIHQNNINGLKEQIFVVSKDFVVEVLQNILCIERKRLIEYRGE